MAVMEQGKRSKMLLGEDRNALTWLLIVNAVMFALISFTYVCYKLYSDNVQAEFEAQVLSLVALPAKGSALLTHPWTIFTYMFTHIELLDFVGSILWLWGFGYMLQDLSGNRRLVPVYLYGGVAGALFFLLGVNFIPGLHLNNSAYLDGAGAPLMAIVVATTTLAPRYRMFPMINGGIPLWVLTTLFVLIDGANIAAKGSAAAFAQLGGALIGFVYILQLKKGNDWGEWMFVLVDKIDSLFNPEKKYDKKTAGQRHFYKASRTPYEKRSNITPQRVDDLLDKINQQGFHSLTDEEKDFLKRASEQQNL